MTYPWPHAPAALFGELSADGRRIGLIGQGDGWELPEIGRALARLTPLLKAATDAQGRKTGAIWVPATWATVTQLAHSFTGNGDGSARWVPLPRLREWIIAEWTRRTAPLAPLTAEYPPWLKLRDYQAQGAAMIAAARKFLLLDEPGTGKTISTIVGLLEIEARGGDIFPMVIVVPSWPVADVWAREIATWAPRWPAPLMYGGPKRAGMLDHPGILVTTYATARIDAADMKGPLVRWRPVTVIADEFHFMKGNSTKQSKAVRRMAVHAVNTIELSGTAITRDTSDLYPPMDAAWPGDFPDRMRWVRRWCRTGNPEYGEKIEGLNPAAEKEFRTVLMGSMRRVAKQDVLDQLPPKIYSVRYADIPPEWRKAYDGMETDMLAELPDGTEMSAMAVQVRFMRLSQLACSAADVEVTEERDEADGVMKKHYNVTLKAPSWKADVLLEILAERRGHPVVSFTPSRQLAMIAGQAAERAGYRVGYVTGTGNGITKGTRKQAIEDLQAGRLDLLSATTGAGGTGITLTAAGTAVFLQRPWFEESVQAEDRVHRIGSEIHEHGVEIIDVIARDTVDSRRRDLLKEHAGQLAAFVQDMRLVRQLLGGLK